MVQVGPWVRNARVWMFEIFRVSGIWCFKWFLVI